MSAKVALVLHSSFGISLYVPLASVVPAFEHKMSVSSNVGIESTWFTAGTGSIPPSTNVNQVNELSQGQILPEKL